METDTGTLFTNSGAVINLSGVYDVQADTGIGVNGGTGQLNVLGGGLLKKSAGGGTSGLNISVTNSGTISVLLGTLAVQNSLTNYDNTAKTLTEAPTLSAEAAPFSFQTPMFTQTAPWLRSTAPARGSSTAQATGSVT